MRRTRSIGAANPESPEAGDGLTPEARALVLRLLSVVNANGAVLPDEMLDEIQAISLEGADPLWQIEEMRKILNRWMPQH